jgi:hypothetical protein
MITQNGRQIIAKYMLGQAPTFATHIAAGVGPLPSSSVSSEGLSGKQSLDFEVFRVPILSKGIIREDGQEKLIFKAQMPNDQRYKITELGLYPGTNNVVAGRYDSKMLITFSTGEAWTYADLTGASAVPYPNFPIDQGNTSASININVSEFSFINSDSSIFNNDLRKSRQEPPRFLNRSLLVSGSTSYLDLSYQPIASSRYLQNPSINIDLSQNLPDDEIKLAFSLVGRYANVNTNPQEIKILMEFVNNVSNIDTVPPKASARFSISDSAIGNNRYKVVTKKISEFVTDTNFSWANINLIKIYTSITNEEIPTSDYFILYDGIRIDNISSINPLYSLVAYNIIETSNQQPVLKEENTNNFIEYRFGFNVGAG